MRAEQLRHGGLGQALGRHAIVAKPRRQGGDLGTRLRTAPFVASAISVLRRCVVWSTISIIARGEIPVNRDAAGIYLRVEVPDGHLGGG